MKRVHLIISGDVQGVGYRAWMKVKARVLGLTGWVRNREDGVVEAVCEGEEKELKEIIRLCYKGPEVAWVKKINAAWEKATGEFVTFAVTF